MVRILSISILALLILPAEARAELRAGASTSNITPEIGLPIVGGFVPVPSTTIHDDLHARTIVLDDGQTRLALVVCDLLGIDRVISEQAREIIFERHGLPPDNVLISATHTHSASSALGKDARALDQPADPYQQFVARRIADGVTRAIVNLKPAEVGFGSVDIEEHVHNRRWHMKPGTAPLNPFGEVDQVKMNPPRGNPNLVKPAGPIDPQVSFISIRNSQDQTPIGVYAAYSLHYVGNVGRGHISADYFAVFADHLKELVHQSEGAAPGFVAMIANGTSGDINNIDFRVKTERKRPYEQIEYVGRDVAEKVYTALADVKYDVNTSLAAAYREPTIQWRKLTEAEENWYPEVLAAGSKSERDLSFIYAQRAQRQASYPETTTAPIQLLRIGDIAIGTMPFEVFCETGLEFRERSPIENSFMVELAHGYFGYLPTRRHFRLGGYETWLGTNRVAQDTSDKLLSELLEMADSIQPE